MRRLLLTASILALASCANGHALEDSAGKISRPNEYSGWSDKIYDGHQRSSFYVEMRDGTKLAVDLSARRRAASSLREKLPVVWMHSPYNRRTYRGGEAAETYPGFALKLAPYGYNVAVADFRGVYASYGKNIAYNRGEWVDAAKYDAYDLTEWFAKQPWSSGKIGMWGCSATGGSQMQALTTRPPSLKAVIPMSAEFDAYSFTTLGGVSGPGPDRAAGHRAGRMAQWRRGIGRQLQSMAQMAQRSCAAAVASHKDNIESVGVVPFKDSVSASTGLTWWEKSSPHTYLDELKKSRIGVLSVANWDEAGTRHGPFFTFNNLPKDNTKLLVGPATHCAWSAVKEETGFDLVTEELRFFDYWLKGKQNNVMREPAVTYFTYNAPKESQWRTSETWPLKNEQRTDVLSSSGGWLDRVEACSSGGEARPPMSAAAGRADHDDRGGARRGGLRDGSAGRRHGGHRPSGDDALAEDGCRRCRCDCAHRRCRAGWIDAVVPDAGPPARVAPYAGEAALQSSRPAVDDAQDRDAKPVPAGPAGRAERSTCCRCRTSSRRGTRCA